MCKTLIYSNMNLKITNPNKLENEHTTNSNNRYNKNINNI